MTTTPDTIPDLTDPPQLRAAIRSAVEHGRARAVKVGNLDTWTDTLTDTLWPLVTEAARQHVARALPAPETEPTS